MISYPISPTKTASWPIGEDGIHDVYSSDCWCKPYAVGIDVKHRKRRFKFLHKKKFYNSKESIAARPIFPHMFPSQPDEETIFEIFSNGGIYCWPERCKHTERPNIHCPM